MFALAVVYLRGQLVTTFIPVESAPASSPSVHGWLSSTVVLSYYRENFVDSVLYFYCIPNCIITFAVLPSPQYSDLNLTVKLIGATEPSTTNQNVRLNL